MNPGLSTVASFLLKIHARALFFLSQGSVDGPLPRPRWSSEAPGKPSASGKGPGCVQSPIVEGVGRAFILPQRVTSEKEPKAVPWPSADPGTGAAPRTTSSSRSSSPSKVMDEGKVSISENL